jgi:hypothetical protein
MEIKEIIAQFEEKRTEFATDLSCFENTTKIESVRHLFRVSSDCSIVLLDRDADFVKTVFSKYASVIEILKSNIKFNQEDTFHFAIYYVDGRHTLTKDIYEVNGLNRKHNDNYYFNSSLVRSITWNVKTNYIGETRGKSRRSIPLRVNQPWTHKPGSKHMFLNAETLRQELMVQLMETAKYYAVIDYLSELEQAEAHMKSVSRYHYAEMHVNLAWRDLLSAKSMKEIKSTKWKRICALNVNAGKMNVFQLNAIKNLRPYITWEQTDRIIQALRNGSGYSTDPRMFAEIVFPALANDNDVRYDIWDVLKMSKDLGRRVDIHPVTHKTVTNLHDRVVVEYRAYQARQEYAGEKNNLKIAEVFQPIVDAVSDDERYEVITLATELIKEGAAMNHCVGSYIDSVNDGDCLIARGRLNNERVTIEFKYDRKEDILYAKQVQMKHNQKPSQETMNDVYELLDSINEKEVDYAKYDWGYHGARRVEADEADFVLPF